MWSVLVSRIAIITDNSKAERTEQMEIEKNDMVMVYDEEDGIGSVIYWTVEVERRVEYKENEWLPCDESGRIDDGYGNEPNATVAYLSSLEGSREERAFELAKNEYLAWLEHKADRYTTVYGYMGLGDRYEQHLL